MKRVYLDNGATTMLDPKVIEAMLPYFTAKYGNASSTHAFGEEAKEALERSRSIIAKSIKAKPDEIIFTSGGTESNNFALKSIAFTNKEKGNHIIVSKTEHKCIMNACKWLEKHGFNITYLDIDKEGFVKPDDLKKAIIDKTILVSIIHGNNETGTINDLRKLGQVCKKHNVYFHTDACQSYTKTELNVKNQDIDLITLNAHKIHGPKGIGVLYIRKGVNIKSWQHGGDHEFGMRAGTENIHGIVGFAEAVKIAMNKKHVAYMANLRDRLIKGVLEIPEVRLNGPTGNKRLCNNANFSFKAVEGEAIGGYLNNKGIASSTGSACSAKTLEPSYVLMAIGLSPEQANSSLRLTLSRFTTQEEIDYTLKVLPEVVKSLRKISPFWKE
ncbi:cysteine desulfurase [Candidatus Woesearchaeota archaeon]|nr:cysteine desulfurase [Candidatus Woesearchaeota archaeon]